MRFLRTNTAARVTVGPFLDKTTGVDPETALTVTACKLTLMVDDANVPTLVLDTAPTASGGANDMVHVTGDDAGFYDLELAAANVNYLGRAMLAITDAATHCPVFHEFMILPAMVYDSMILGTDTLNADVTQFGGTNLTAASGIPEVKVASIAASAITAAAIATDAIDADAIAANAIDAGAIAADAITAAKLAADVTTEIQSGLATAAALATVDDFLDTEIAAIKADTAAILIDTTEIGVAGAGLTNINLPNQTMDVTGTWNGSLTGSVGSAGSVTGAVAGSVGSIATGGITNNSFAADAIDADALAANAVAEIANQVITQALTDLGLVIASGTIGATGNTTTALHLAGLAYANDAINSMTLVIKDVSTSLFYSRWIEDWADTGDLATVATLPFTPEASVDLYWILPTRADVTGGSGLDAAGVRAAIGLASANLDTQLDALPTNAELATALGTADDAVLAAIAALNNLSQANIRTALGMATANLDTQIGDLPTNAELATALGTADDAVLAAIAALNNLSQANVRTAVGLASANLDTQLAATATAAALATVAGYVDTEIAAIKAKTDNLPTDPADASDIAASFVSIASTLSTLASYVDTEVAAIKAKTDSLTFTVAGAVDANIQRVNDVAVVGTGAPGDEWGA